MIEIKNILDVEKNLKEIDAVIFDLDDTLYPEKDYVRSGYKRIGQLLNKPELAEKMWEVFQRGGKAIDEVLEAEGMLEQKENALKAYRLQNPEIQLFSGVAEMLGRLKTDGKKIGIITDGRPEGQRAKLNALNLQVDEVIITDELGGIEFRKPNESAFRLMQKKLNVPFDRMAYVGDNLSKDFIAPEKLGMRCIHFGYADGLYYVQEGRVGQVKLSFILPVYNVEKYIENCLDSIYAQGLKEEEFEVICVNDGSTDHSCQILEGYQNRHSNLIIKTIENSGQGRARNIGIGIANGRYLFFVDSDDYIAREVISSLINKAIETDVDMLFFDNWRGAEDDFYTAQYMEIDNQEPEILDGKNYFEKRFPGNSPCLFLIKKEFIERESVRFVEGHYCEDGMFVVNCISKARTCMYCHVDVYRYVCRPNSTITLCNDAHRIKMINDFIYAIEYIHHFVDDAIKNEDGEGYIKNLIRRRNSYIFFLQIRIIKAKLDKSKRHEIMGHLKRMKCYPYTSMGYSEFKFRFLEKLFQRQMVFGMLCVIYKIVNH